jgi:hypothetical protein
MNTREIHSLILEMLPKRDRWRYRVVRAVTWPLENFFRGIVLAVGLFGVFQLIFKFGWWKSVGAMIPTFLVIHFGVTQVCNALEPVSKP